MLLTLIFQFYHISCLIYFFNMLIRISRPTGPRLSLGLLGLDYNWPTVNLQIGQRRKNSLALLINSSLIIISAIVNPHTHVFSPLPFPLEPAADPIDTGSSSSSLEMNDDNVVVSTHNSSYDIF